MRYRDTERGLTIGWLATAPRDLATTPAGDLLSAGTVFGAVGVPDLYFDRTEGTSVAALDDAGNAYVPQSRWSEDSEGGRLEHYVAVRR